MLVLRENNKGRCFSALQRVYLQLATELGLLSTLVVKFEKG